MIPAHDVKIATEAIDRSGAADIFDAALRTDRRGRKRHTGTRLFLIGALLTVQHRREITSVGIHKVLTTQISHDMQFALGVRYWHNEEVRTIPKSKIDYLVKTMAKKLDWSRESQPELSDDERDRRRAAVNDICDRLLDATLIESDSTMRAIDGSGTWAWSRGSKIGKQQTTNDDPDYSTPSALAAERDPMAHDTDAAYGVKTKKDGRSEWYFGYELHASVRVPAGPDTRPVQVERFQLTPAGDDLVKSTLPLIDRARAAGHTITDVIVDRHYSYKNVQAWARPLRERGINQHLDLRANEQGFRDHEGVKIAAAWPHCPATPSRLGTIPRPGPDASEDKEAAFRATIEERRAYAMHRVERPNANERMRAMCPAVYGSVGCPLREKSVRSAEESGLPIVVNPPAPETAPKCCTQTTVSIKDPTVTKLDQPKYWGSKEWEEIYNRRSYVEGAFGSLKNPSAENVNRGFNRYTGLSRRALFMGVAIMAMNLRHLQRWHERTGNGPTDHFALQPAPETSFVEIDSAQIIDLDRTYQQAA